MPDDADAGFFRNLTGLATEYVRAKRRSLAQGDPTTNVDSTGGGHRHSFGGQEITFEDLRDIKDIRDSGGQVAQLMTYKALLNFGEGAEIHVENNDDHVQIVDGEEKTLQEHLEEDKFPNIDLQVLDLGEDALWYPAAYGELRETRGGGFSEALPAEPWTILPNTDAKGEVVNYVQRTKTPGGGYAEEPLDPDDLWSIVLNKASARDKTGISEVLRNEDEIRAFKENEQAINQAIELHGFPQRHVKVGREEGAPVSDDDLRRVRTIFDPRSTDANTAYFTGQDVSVETLEAHQFDYTAIHEMDMRNLTTALGLPLEAGNVGSDGLGSGKPAELRFAMLKLAIQANQRSFGVQFVESVMRPVIRDYSPFDHTATITLDIGDPLEDIGDMADVIGKIGEYMTNDQIARKLDLPEPEDDEIGESYRSPADIEKAEEGDGADGDPLAGLIGEGRELQDVADIDTGDYPEAAVENARMALEAREDHGNPNDCGTRVGWERANQLDNGEELSEETINRMASFRRHEDNYDPDADRDDCGWLMWKAWGGEAGVSWAEDKAEEFDEARENSALAGDTDFGNALAEHRCLAGVADRDLANAPEWDRPLLEMYRGVSDPESDPDRALVDFAASGTPEFVLERIREAVMSGAMFSSFDGIDDGRLMDFRQEFADAVGTDNFTLDSITESVMEFSDLPRQDAERIARTESSAVLNKAREMGYEERGEGDERFYWTGASLGDARQTDACAWLIRQTNPFEGGTPVPMNELKDLIDEAPTHDDDMDNDLARPESFVVHPNERSSFVLEPSAGV